MSVSIGLKISLAITIGMTSAPIASSMMVWHFDSLRYVLFLSFVLGDDKHIQIRVLIKEKEIKMRGKSRSV